MADADNAPAAEDAVVAQGENENKPGRNYVCCCPFNIYKN